MLKNLKINENMIKINNYKKNSSKKLTYQVTTSKTGTATLKARTNLKGYELTIYVGKIAITKSKPIVRV
jgi:hypothetical protein